MATFVMLGRYSVEAIKGISSGRTQKAAKAVEKAGGKIQAIYGLLGSRDLLIVAELPNAEAALKASVALTQLTGIAFSTSPAFPIEQFDKLLS
jgi:uncharacterized protein with GYD domain